MDNKGKSRRDSEFADEMKGQAINMERAMFYRDGYRSIVKIALYMSATVLVLAAISGFLAYNLAHKDRDYFAMSPDGRVLKITPFSEPSTSENRILQLVGDSATCVFTYDYVNFRNQLGACKSNFTSNGWLKFTEELNNSKIINLVNSERLVLSATRISSPVIVDQGVIDGVLAWKIQVPIRVTFAGRQNNTTEDYVVSMTAVRVSQMDYTDGIAINSFVAQKNQKQE